MITLKEQVGALGIQYGTSLFVHSSIKAVGPDVRAEELIDALRNAIGENGTLLFPTLTTREEEYFDPAITPSAMGIVSENYSLAAFEMLNSKWLWQVKERAVNLAYAMCYDEWPKGYLERDINILN